MEYLYPYHTDIVVQQLECSRVVGPSDLSGLLPLIIIVIIGHNVGRDPQFFQNYTSPPPSLKSEHKEGDKKEEPD